MRRVKYKGPERNLGTHGIVKTGAAIMMTEAQIENALRSPELYELIDELEDPDVFILPVAVLGYRDLRIIPWNQPHLKRHLNRLGHSGVLAVARAMFAIGMELDEFTKETSRAILIDTITCEAKRHGWMDRGMQSNRELGIYDPENKDTHEVQFDLVRADRVPASDGEDNADLSETATASEASEASNDSDDATSSEEDSEPVETVGDAPEMQAGIDEPEVVEPHADKGVEVSPEAQDVPEPELENATNTETVTETVEEAPKPKSKAKKKTTRKRARRKR